ncbi:ABC transporter ATP-binding protein [Sulfobacillus harzensis]|uniref:ABC transporter ATP-binding protein n=1 Tax=Sulfobacillus harzensis TaxID=2729629 RepID=A0A7Y0L4Y0_9FIRM|nr:ABC transporter ATP-binding protein [Sulfobacillus harzensis]NMP22781.1 ABC transporter ATP-binding protein [Sulfobacillus harzensis]
MDALLKAEGMNTGYDQLQILWDAALEVKAGERVVVLGSNGAGKTTLLKSLVGLLPLWSGTVEFDGQPVHRLRIDGRVRRGMAYMSEVGIIADLSVEDNLRIGGYFSSREKLKSKMEAMFEEFPILKERRQEAAASLSGGQRKMLAAARALMGDPKLLIMDEPSAGLSPLLVTEILNLVKSLEGRNIAFLIAEQNIKFLEVATRVYVLDSGRMIFNGTVDELQRNDAIRRAYFGVDAV